MNKNGKYSDPIRIRAHHLLCIQGFQGYGYNTEFKQEMGEIISFIYSNPLNKLQIITKTDEICKYCPHEIAGSCSKENYSELKLLDELVLKKTFLNENEVYTFEMAKKVLDDNLKYEDIIEICGNCFWTDKCLFFIEKTCLD
jgi:uncharacterized protein